MVKASYLWQQMEIYTLNQIALVDMVIGIYMAEKTENGYKTPINLGLSINTEFNESDPYVSPDESYIIFGSYNRKDGLGSSDLYISFRQNNGEFGDPINLGGIINTPYLEHNPHVTADGKYFFFSTDKPGLEGDEYKIANFNIYYMSAEFIDELSKYDYSNYF
jgi:Tol biopolymer transport system component